MISPPLSIILPAVATTLSTVFVTVFEGHLPKKDLMRSIRSNLESLSTIPALGVEAIFEIDRAEEKNMKISLRYIFANERVDISPFFTIDKREERERERENRQTEKTFFYQSQKQPC